MTFDFDQHYKDEWRNLGFYYDFDEVKNCWRIIGSKQGVLKFCDALNEYANNPTFLGISEHKHFGPDSYLKIVTWNTPIIKKDGIYGTMEDFKKLGTLIRSNLFMGRGKIIVDKDYSNDNQCFLLIDVRDKYFDPIAP